MSSVKDKFAIVGIGQTEFTLDSHRSELDLACEAILAATKDAGITIDDIDGIVQDSPVYVDVIDIGHALGFNNQGFFIQDDGGHCSSLLHAITGFIGGRATKNIVCFKSINGSSKRRGVLASSEPSDPYEDGFNKPFGYLSPVVMAAMAARRHMHEYGTTSQHFANIAVACRKHGNNNPNAILHDKPLTIEDHQKSRIVADPLRQSDCYAEADGAMALIVTTAPRAKQLRQPPVYIMAAAQACGPYVGRLTKNPTLKENETTFLAQQLFDIAGIPPSDIDVVQVCDYYTPLALMALEDLGFCKKGEGGPFSENGRLEWPNGELPLNTSGGSLSEGFLEGFNLIIEAVRQLRGTSTAQVKDAETALVTSANAGPTSGLILRR